MNRLHRKLVSLIGILALLFAQLAVSAYACPFQMQPSDAAVAGASMHDDGAAMLDPDAPALCQQHCQYGTQTLNDAPPALPPPVLLPALVAVIDFQPVASAIAGAANPSRLIASTPPLSIRNCCFRI